MVYDTLGSENDRIAITQNCALRRQTVCIIFDIVLDSQIHRIMLCHAVLWD